MAKLISSQIEQLREIGAYLRQVRQEQGIDLEDVAHQIFIRPTLLRSLEAGTDEHLPEPVFVQGFIRRYGDALGINGQALAEKFSVTPVAVLPVPREAAAHGANGVVEPQTRNSLKVIAKAEDMEPRPSASKVPWALIGSVSALVVMLFLLVWGLTSRREQAVTEAPAPSGSQVEANPADANQSETNPAETEAASEAEAPEAGLETSTAAPAAPVVAVVNLTDRSWIRVTTDGSTVFEGILESGTEETWTAENSIVITSGNAGGVELAVNGGDAVAMGAAGRVQTITLTPDTDPDSLSQAAPE
ncbi:hypothetical protein C7271_02730 [filamentous cyanobacterium CCP5]|nr:hypothetical protein C7271_02730 [filamentous cyanobacterium CCP5]